MALEAIYSVLQQTHGFLKHYKLSNYTPILYTFALNIFVFFFWKVLMRYIYIYLNDCCQLISLLLLMENSQFICKLSISCLFLMQSDIFTSPNLMAWNIIYDRWQWTKDDKKTIFVKNEIHRQLTFILSLNFSRDLEIIDINSTTKQLIFTAKIFYNKELFQTTQTLPNGNF